MVDENYFNSVRQSFMKLVQERKRKEFEKILEEAQKTFYEETEEGKKHVWFRLYDEYIEFLDQRLLPHKEQWVRCYDERDVASAIKSMVVRGAPAIGIAASFGVFYGLKKRVQRRENLTYEVFREIKETLFNTRPTAFNLQKALDEMEEEFKVSGGDIDKIYARAKKIWFSDFLSCYLIGRWGSEVIPEDGFVFTICNTGSLATGGWGTAFSAIKFAKKLGKNFEVVALETRPFLQGSRLTAWELLKEKIPFYLIVDSSAPFMMKKILDETPKSISVLTGADRILRNGTTANKIGTFMLALSAKMFSIPFYVLAPSTTIDKNSEYIVIESRSEEEVKSFGGVQVAPKPAKALNFVFDITPPDFISGIITEEGIFSYPYNFD
jgi:methylthioribose-1-phosphate isomerase